MLDKLTSSYQTICNYRMILKISFDEGGMMNANLCPLNYYVSDVPQIICAVSPKVRQPLLFYLYSSPFHNLSELYRKGRTKKKIEQTVE